MLELRTFRDRDTLEGHKTTEIKQYFRKNQVDINEEKQTNTYSPHYCLYGAQIPRTSRLLDLKGQKTARNCQIHSELLCSFEAIVDLLE